MKNCNTIQCTDAETGCVNSALEGGENEIYVVKNVEMKPFEIDLG